MIPVILSGGSGTRLWPLSRPHYPKQFLSFYSGQTLFQDTLSRLNGLSLSAPIIVSNDEHRFIVADNLRQMGVTDARIFLEPLGRNTAPAIAIAAFAALDQSAAPAKDEGDDPVLFVLPADHVVEDQARFVAAAAQAEMLARQDRLVTFGIKPSSPHTGYGYIECGAPLAEGAAYEIAAFKEKPDAATAQAFLESGTFLWNSGMFVFKASRYLNEIKAHDPALYEAARKAYETRSHDLGFERLEEESFAACPNISIDYAVMEKTAGGVVVSMDAGWSDIGSWSSLWDILPKDRNGNVLRGDVLSLESSGNYIHAEDTLVATLGIHNLIVVDTKDALMIAARDKVEDLKKIVESLQKQNRREAQHHRVIYRPWGHYDSVSAGPRDQVRRITVLPGKSMALQKHVNRAEHWVVVRGKARVTRGDETLTLEENQSVYIPMGAAHALANAGEELLEVVEVQTGTSFGAEDVERLGDHSSLSGRKP